MTNRLATQLMTLCAGLALAGAACTVNSTDIPSLAGPSELALSFFLTATPDSISHDGVSQSAIVVTAKGPNGQAAAGVPFRLDMFVGGQAADYGTLSGKTVVTGSDGTARAVYTVPPRPPSGATVGSCLGLPGTCVGITATPIGTNAVAGDHTQEVFVRLVPLGVILPPADTPTASFFVTPTPVTANVSTNFDGSASCGGQVTNGTCASGNIIVTYQWGFGDGGTATGRTASHKYPSAGTYTAVLTVTNDGGRSATTTQSISVAAGANPSAAFVFSPSAPVANQVIQFNALTSQAAPGRTLVRWDWNWGDGSTGSGQLEDHDYATAGTYNVVLIVTDDAGLTGTSARTVTVGGANPTASLIITKSVLTITANGSGSTAVSGSSIVNYLFVWGDGTPNQSGAAGIGSHTYAAAGTYPVTLTVTDSLLPTGRTGTVIQNVTVP